MGAALGWVVGVGALAVPGLGPLLAAGPIIAALTGAGGAVVGGVVGSVIGTTMPEFEALQYNEKMDGGNILLSVHTEDAIERERAGEIFKHAGAVTAAEAVVDQAHGRPSRIAPVAMQPTSPTQQIKASGAPSSVNPLVDRTVPS